jgi:hypothetical protein
MKALPDLPRRLIFRSYLNFVTEGKKTPSGPGELNSSSFSIEPLIFRPNPVSLPGEVNLHFY